MNQRPPYWWLPSAVIAAVGVAAILLGQATGGPDALDGIIIGALALATACVMLIRRVSE